MRASDSGVSVGAVACGVDLVFAIAGVQVFGVPTIGTPALRKSRFQCLDGFSVTLERAHAAVGVTVASTELSRYVLRSSYDLKSRDAGCIISQTLVRLSGGRLPARYHAQFGRVLLHQVTKILTEKFTIMFLDHLYGRTHILGNRVYWESTHASERYIRMSHRVNGRGLGKLGLFQCGYNAPLVVILTPALAVGARQQYVAGFFPGRDTFEKRHALSRQCGVA